MCKDKTHGNVQDDDIREKIINGQLQRDDCDSIKAYRFLKLLKRGANVSNEHSITEQVKEQQ